MDQQAKQSSLIRRHYGKILALTAFGLMSLVAAYTWATLSYTYSEGDRVGYLQKLSKRGWICRTWEGELAMSTAPGSKPEIFRFTVPEDAVADAINELQGKRVALHYEQKKFVPTSCFGDTEYFIVRARELK